MKTLELTDIVGYLPYDLRVIWCKKEYRCLSVIKRDSIFVVITEDNELETHNPISAIEHINPILRPLSDLYRTITHNGKEIVPIAECAKIAFGDYGFYLTEVIDNDGTNTYCASAEFQEENISFFYDVKYGFSTNDSYDIIYNQYKIFDFLHELKIDYRGLIDAGLAIDANTLENNPYKELNHTNFEIIGWKTKEGKQIKIPFMGNK